MTEPKPPEENLTEEFRNLGKNLVQVLRNAWESPERQRLQQEIEAGLSDLRTTMQQEVGTFNESPAGQRIRSDVDDLRERIRSGEMEAKIRSELLNALRLVNTELGKVSSQWPGSQPPPAEAEQATPSSTKTPTSNSAAGGTTDEGTNL